MPTPHTLSQFFSPPAPWSEMGFFCLDYPGEDGQFFVIARGGEDDPDGDFPGTIDLGGDEHTFLCHPPYCLTVEPSSAYGVFVYPDVEERE